MVAPRGSSWGLAALARRRGARWQDASCTHSRYNFSPVGKIKMTEHLKASHLLIAKCYFILSQGCLCACSIVSNSLRPHRLSPPSSFLCPWDFPGKNTGVSCHFLLQGIFPTQESNPGLLHCRQILLPLSHQGGPAGIVFNPKKGRRD